MYCGQFSGDYSWEYAKKDANQLRVSFLNGVLHIKAYWCDSFDGPTEAGIVCAIEAFSSACPGQVGHNHTCVYEVETRRFSSTTVRNAVEVTTGIATVVKEIAGFITIKSTRERVKVQTYLYKQRSYIIIPAGYSFCSYSRVKSEPDYHSPTGFRWSCELPTYVQTVLTIGEARCTDLTLCESQSLCPASDDEPTSSNKGVKPAIWQPTGILTVLFINLIYGGDL